MATFDAVDHYFSGQGVVMLADRDNSGNPTGFTPVGNVSDLKITVAASVLEHKESHTGARGTDLRLTTELKCGLSMTMENFIAQNLADALRGEVTSITGTSVTNQAAKFYPGKVISLGKINVSAVTVTDPSPTPANLVAGTDYFLNADAGSIQFADTVTGLVSGDALEIDFTYGDQKRVDSLTVGAPTKYMRFEGLNTADSNAPVVVEVFKFLTDPLKELSMISDGIQQFVLEGSVLADNLQTTGSKYFRILKAV